MRSTTARDGTVLAYRQEGHGPTTLLVHAGFLDSRAWLGLIPLLARDRTVVAPDRRGHGSSGAYGGHHRLEDDVDDLVDMTRELDPEGHGVQIVAHSAGCHVALAAACTGLPISRLVMYEPPAFGDPAIEGSVWQQLADAAEADDRRGLVELVLNDVVGVSTGERIPPPAFSALFSTPFGQMLLDNALAIPTELHAHEDFIWSEVAIGAVDVPILLLIGADSPPFNRRFADWVAGVAPSAVLTVVPNAGHGWPMDHPGTFAALVDHD